MNEEHWSVRGLCYGADPEKFFPNRGESTAEARELCRSCPVRRECLMHALTKPEKFGIWGGLTERERRRVRRRMLAAQIKINVGSGYR